MTELILSLTGLSLNELLIHTSVLGTLATIVPLLFISDDVEPSESLSIDHIGH